MALGNNITCKKRERGSDIVFPIILRLLIRISNGEGAENFDEENQDSKIKGWGRISRFRELYTPLEKSFRN